MTLESAEREALEELDARLRTLLPEDYQDVYETLQPTPMRAAGLVLDADGRVAWDQIWGSFCDLAVAGGPPHKGTLLGPGTAAAIESDVIGYGEVVAEIGRGITMVTGLPVDAASPGWVRITCADHTMAAWLLRAIVVENVAVHARGRALYLPAAPDFRLDKEIKNVVTVVAKTCHYWVGHMPAIQRAAIGRLFANLDAEAALLAPLWPPADEPGASDRLLAKAIGDRIYGATHLGPSGHTYAGWVGIECPNVRAAVWMMRALVAGNVLSRREGGAVFLPVNLAEDPTGEQAAGEFVHVHRLASARGAL